MLFLAILFMNVNINAQVRYGDARENWSKLIKVEYELSHDEYGDIYLPIFNESVQQMNGKEITLSGFIIPFEGMFKPNHLILSQLPIATCFFCGAAGPETVVEVYLDEPTTYTPDPVSIAGILELNSNDDEQLMYILKNARLHQN